MLSRSLDQMKAEMMTYHVHYKESVFLNNTRAIQSFNHKNRVTSLSMTCKSICRNVFSISEINPIQCTLNNISIPYRLVL